MVEKEVHTYGRWKPTEIGNVAEDPDRCPFEFWPEQTPTYQCPNPRGDGSEGEWCPKHAAAYRRFQDRGI